MKRFFKKVKDNPIFIGVVLVVLATLFAYISVNSANRSRIISAYPTVTAEVLRCAEYYDRNDDGDEYIDYYRIDFEYEVDGKTYTVTDRWSKSSQRGSITVYYNPNNPEDVFLESAAQGEGNMFLFVITGVLGALGLGTLGYEFAAKRKRKQDQ